MGEILKRLTRVVRSYIGQSTGEARGNLNRPSFSGRESGRARNEEASYSNASDSDARSSFNESTASHDYCGVPKQVVEDLSLFELTPPSSLDEVRRARNREMKKYHSDRYLDDPEKLETSKEIMQIYNAAYERLRQYYEGR